MSITLNITMSILILNFALAVLILFLYLRAKGFRGVLPSRHHSSRRLIFAPYEPFLPQRALDLSILDAIPITIFKSKDFGENGGLECAVCISESTDGKEVRLLPKCQHGFHVDCIDMWFSSNSTSPLCREELSLEIVIPNLEEVSENVSTTMNLNEVGYSSSSSLARYKEGMLVIDIPRRKVDGFSILNSPLPLSRLSPSSPLLTSRGVIDSTGAREVEIVEEDLEQRKWERRGFFV